MGQSAVNVSYAQSAPAKETGLPGPAVGEGGGGGNSKERDTAREKAAATCLELLPGRIRCYNLLQDAPVSPRDPFWDAAAALKVELIHLFADVILEHSCICPATLLECRHSRACRCLTW